MRSFTRRALLDPKSFWQPNLNLANNFGGPHPLAGVPCVVVLTETEEQTFQLAAGRGICLRAARGLDLQ